MTLALSGHPTKVSMPKPVLIRKECLIPMDVHEDGKGQKIKYKHVEGIYEFQIPRGRERPRNPKHPFECFGK